MVGDISPGMAAIAHRGPDGDGIAKTWPFTIGHTRLAVQDLSTASAQPFASGRITLTYNGELWAPELLRSLLQSHGQHFTTSGDTEVVAAALDTYGLDALPMLDGMFALAWTDGENLYLARDEFGEVPLHVARTASGALIYASEVAALLALGAVPSTICWLAPGHYAVINAHGQANTRRWAAPLRLTPAPDDGSLRDLLTQGCVNRMTADVPVAVLASGGLDSSAILALLVAAGYTPTCYTAVGDPNSRDLRCARLVAEHLGLDLCEVEVPPVTKESLSAAVLATEMPHKAQVEIALACLPLAARIAADGFKVVLSGEGSDELWASYGMAYHGVARQGWHHYRADTFTDQHRKNFARTNKVFMAAGVEARLPFLHAPLVRYGLRLNADDVRRDHPKGVLAHAVADLLPPEVTWRAKAAFQTQARLDVAAAAAVADPARFYKAEYQCYFGGVKA